MFFRWARLKIADWQVLASCLLIFLVVDVIPSHLVLCFVFPIQPHKIAIREFKLKVNWPHRKCFKMCTWKDYVFDWTSHSTSVISLSSQAKWYVLIQFKYLIPFLALSFNGETFKTEASSKFPHYDVCALGSYRNSPFVTGQNSRTNGLKTEILNYELAEWEQAGDYPFSNGYL